jgi:tetratricopeptide (TPR) repeat protein
MMSRRVSQDVSDAGSRWAVMDLPGWPARRPSGVAVLVLAAAAVVFGIWATVAGSSGVFGRLTGLVGVCVLVLVAVLAVARLFAFAQGSVDAQRPARDLIMVPMAMSSGSGPDTLTFPVIVDDDSPEPEPEPEPEAPPDSMVQLAAVWAAEPDGVGAGVLELMSVLSAGGIRRGLILTAGRAGRLGGGPGAEVDEHAVDAALGQLAERSLLSLSPDGRVVSADRPVLRAVRDRLAEQQRLPAECQAAAAVLEARSEALAGAPDRPAMLDLPDQVRALRDVVGGLPGGPDAELAVALLRLRGWALYHLNALGDQARRAIVIGEPLVTDTERVLGPEDPDTLAAQNNLANAYQMAGRIDEAIALHEQVVAGRERVLGPDHPDTVAARNNLAAAYRSAGRTEDGVDYEQSPTDPDAIVLPEPAPAGLGTIARHEQVLADRERLLGPDDPDTLAARNNLAVAYQAAGRTDEAITLHEQALADRERVLGPDHPATLNSRSNLAVAYQAAGRTDEAITLHQQVLADRERVLGPDHPDTDSSRNNLVRACQAAGRPPS